MTGLTVAKVGGSLFDLPDLRERLLGWGRARPGPTLFVSGGGPAADVIRDLDRRHGLGEGPSHWIALRMLAVNAHFLSALLGVPVVAGWPADWLHEYSATGGSERSRTGVVDAHVFCSADESNADPLPHAWRVTSDSVAARVAAVAGGHLVLLKSCDLPPGWTWQQAAAARLVDEAFPGVVERHGLGVTWVNLRRPNRDPAR
jgi:hypothetical protein